MQMFVSFELNFCLDHSPSLAAKYLKKQALPEK